MWYSEKYMKPMFGKPVLCYCRIYGHYVSSYESLYPDNENNVWGNWVGHDGKLGALPPVYWMYFPELPKDQNDIDDLPF